MGSLNIPSRESEKSELKLHGVSQIGIDGWATYFVGPLGCAIKTNALRAGKPAWVSDILTHLLSLTKNELIQLHLLDLFLFTG